MWARWRHHSAAATINHRTPRHHHHRPRMRGRVRVRDKTCLHGSKTSALAVGSVSFFFSLAPFSMNATSPAFYSMATPSMYNSHYFSGTHSCCFRSRGATLGAIDRSRASARPQACTLARRFPMLKFASAPACRSVYARRLLDRRAAFGIRVCLHLSTVLCGAQASPSPRPRRSKVARSV